MADEGLAFTEYFSALLTTVFSARSALVLDCFKRVENLYSS